MNPLKTTEKLNNAGKSLKQAGKVFVITLVITIITALFFYTNSENMANNEYYGTIYLIICFINLILFFVIAIKLIEAGSFLTEIPFNIKGRSKEEIEEIENSAKAERVRVEYNKNLFKYGLTAIIVMLLFLWVIVFYNII
jgi:hypothetical protein